ncbi:hypothetical protein A4H97_10245 [Niastella yeongjuensis]|uniref:Uncharacterized protein n=1 Tax=Niastella yeongjuensis TaxID=354355 RepID=A0A1V9EFK4_9BACT|nr:hypothetical protein [Niastella yeongjuensis]OQP44734.1 hypothetical protein A4H97_10245 [Niastella yeongjuensis]SEO77289.1 hypothetical protein SAMN05660816_03489 [Niastella yeongjuensis]
MFNYNEEEVRLEPTDTKCNFCKTGNSTSMDDNHYIPMFKTKDSTYLIVYSYVKYQQVGVGISRCASCRSIHDNASSRASLIAWITAVAFVILTFAIWGIWGVVGIIGGIIIGFVGTFLVQTYIISNKDILTKEEGSKDNAGVLELKLHGWSLRNPAA